MNKNGFTLIEIVTMSLIVGLLGVLTVPGMLKGVNRSYAQDVARNLMAIYAGQQNYFQKNNTYLACTDLAAINTGLGMSILPSSALMTFSCTVDTCIGSAPASVGGFTMDIDLTSPITVNSAPKYCTGVATPNPCCSTAGGGTAGALCP